MKKFSVGLVIIAVVSGTFVTAQESWIDWNQDGLMDPYENPALTVEERVNDLISRMTLKEKISQTGSEAPAIERLGIPEYDWWNECLHGVARAGIATVFPQAIGMASTWDPDLIYKVAGAISDEARAKHAQAIAEGNRERYYGLTFWSPVVNIARDPRWGRTQEGYGEDPYLVSRLGVAFVKGLQGDDPKYLKLVATPKHYAVNNEEWRRHSGSAEVAELVLREYYLPHFKTCITEGKAQSVMCAYNAINDVPCCCNKKLLTDLLRDEWRFNGYVVSDCGAIGDICWNHHFVSTPKEAVAEAINAGCDLNCGGLYQKHLGAAVEDELVSEETIDQAVARLFVARFRLGIFDPPEMVPYAQIPYEVVDCEEHRQLARQTARESIVLLKNEHNLLPLSKGIKSIAVVGPYANRCQFGNYSGTPSRAVTPWEGIENKVGDMIEITDIPEDADVVIVVAGLSKEMEGEGQDRTYLDLPAEQESLIEGVSGVNKNTVVVLIGGSAITMGGWIEEVPAVLVAWYPGEEGGNAIADVLFGDYNPGGRLPLTFPASIEQLPRFDDYDIREGRTYMYLKEEPLFPFGYGLSYTKFEYNNLKITPQKSLASDINLSVDIKNIGEQKGDEVVQLYLKDVESSIETPMKELKRFKRITLEPGETKKVNLKLKPDDLAFYDKDMKWVIEPGIFKVMMGSSSEDIRLTGSFEIVKE